MTRITSKLLVAGAVAAFVVAVSAAPSDAARKRARAASPACSELGYCASNCANGWCDSYICVNGKYQRSVIPYVCVQGACANVQKKCVPAG